MENSKLGNMFSDFFKISEESGANKCIGFSLGVSIFYLLFALAVTAYFHFSYFISPPVEESVSDLWRKILMYSYFPLGAVVVSGAVKAPEKYLSPMTLIYVIVGGFAAGLAVYYGNVYIDTGLP